MKSDNLKHDISSLLNLKVPENFKIIEIFDIKRS